MLKAIELDFGTQVETAAPDGTMLLVEEVFTWLQGAGLERDVDFDVVTLFGPAGGNPVIRFVTTAGTMERLVMAYDGDNGEVEYLLEHVTDA